MPGPGLPTNRVATTHAGLTPADHDAHHDAEDAILNKFDTTNAATAGNVPVGTGSLFVARQLTAADIASGTVATARLGSGAASGTVFLRGDQTWATPSGTTAPDASTTVKGIVQLAGDLAGTAVAPTVPGLANKAATSHAHAAADVTSGTVATARLGSGAASTTTYLRGDNTWTAPPTGGTAAGWDIGLSNGTNDTAQIQAALAAKAGGVCLATPGQTYIINAFQPGSPANGVVMPINTTLDFQGSKLSVRAASMPSNATGEWHAIDYKTGCQLRNFDLDCGRGRITTTGMSNVQWFGISPYAGTSGAILEDITVHHVLSVGGLECFGLTVTGGTDIDVRNIEAYQVDGTGVHVDGDPTGTNATNIRVDGVNAYDNVWMGISIFGANNIVCSNLVCHDNTQNGINVEWAYNVQVNGGRVYNNGIHGLGTFGKIDALRASSVDAFNNGAAQQTLNGDGAQFGFRSSGYISQTGMAQTATLVDCSSDPKATGAADVYIGRSGTIANSSSYAQRIILDCDHAEQWIIGCSDIQGSRDAAVVIPGIVFGRLPRQRVPIDAYWNWTKSGSVTQTAYTGAGKTGAAPFTMAVTAQFGNSTVRIPTAGKYLVRLRFSPTTTGSWNLNVRNTGDTVNSPGVIFNPQTTDLNLWFETEFVVNAAQGSAQNLQIINTSAVAGTHSLIIDEVNVYAIGDVLPDRIPMWQDKGLAYRSAAPTVGAWAVGDVVRNTAPAEAGSAASKYVVVGWICTVAGSPGTWLATRCLTGN